eukprot:4747541-Prymnesium_polylepis.3
MEHRARGWAKYGTQGGEGGGRRRVREQASQRAWDGMGGGGRDSWGAGVGRPSLIPPACRSRRQSSTRCGQGSGPRTGAMRRAV